MTSCCWSSFKEYVRRKRPKHPRPDYNPGHWLAHGDCLYYRQPEPLTVLRRAGPLVSCRFRTQLPTNPARMAVGPSPKGQAQSARMRPPQTAGHEALSPRPGPLPSEPGADVSPFARISKAGHWRHGNRTAAIPFKLGPGLRQERIAGSGMRMERQDFLIGRKHRTPPDPQVGRLRIKRQQFRIVAGGAMPDIVQQSIDPPFEVPVMTGPRLPDLFHGFQHVRHRRLCLNRRQRGFDIHGSLPDIRIKGLIGPLSQPPEGSVIVTHR